MQQQSNDRLGVAVVGMGGAVATTAAAGIEMIKAGSNDFAGLPLAESDAKGLAPYRNIVFGGWDLCPDDLGAAALGHGVVGEKELSGGASALRDMRAWPAIGSEAFCRNVTGKNVIAAKGHRDAVERIQGDLTRFKEEEGLDRTVLINLASTERVPNADDEAFGSIDSFERALDDDHEEISPAMLYAYAAITADVPYGNFTPSVAADLPVLAALAAERGVPVAGKDGKTGQTFVKTVIAPALKARSLYVEGWFSTNILGNRDGLALDDEKSLESKIGTKLSVLDQILGYRVPNHQVHIHYYPPRGDDKEAWDNIDLSGFMGQKMQMKIDFLCKDSVLAAPLAIEIARTLDLARQRGEGGVQEQLSVFFKMPQTGPGREPEHAFLKQQAMLEGWLAAD